MKLLLLAAVAASALVTATASSAHQTADVRFATFNASLNRPAPGQLAEQLAAPAAGDVFHRQIRNVAEVVQRVRPDVLLINEFDYDPAAVDLFRDNFLEVGQNGAAPIDYPYAFVAPSNTGIPSGQGPQQRRRSRDDRRRARLRRRRLRLRRLSGPVRDGRLLEVPDQDRGRAHLPAVPLGRHAWQPDPGAVLLARRDGDPPALVQEPLGRADQDRRRRSSTSSSRTRRRRSSTARKIATAGATSTRSASGPTTLTAAQGPLHLRRQREARRPQAGQAAS